MLKGGRKGEKEGGKQKHKYMKVGYSDRDRDVRGRSVVEQTSGWTGTGRERPGERSPFKMKE